MTFKSKKFEIPEMLSHLNLAVFAFYHSINSPVIIITELNKCNMPNLSYKNKLF